jgi:hypothetical protein
LLRISSSNPMLPDQANTTSQQTCSSRSVTTPLTNCLNHSRLRNSSQLPRRCFHRIRYGLTDA